MIDLKSLTDEKTYRIWKGSSWPTYEEFVTNTYKVSSEIQVEIDNFIQVLLEEKENKIAPKTIELSISNQKRQKQIFFDKHLTKNTRCRVPWNTLGVNANGNVYICQSPSWVPIFVGNIFETDNIYDILNSEKSKKIRQEILANRYYYCNNTICPFFGKLKQDTYTSSPINENDLKELELIESPDLYVNKIPSELIFDFDYTCNFKCPSCRTETQNWNNDHIRRPVNDKIVEKIKTMIVDKIDNQPVTIRWCGGEPLMSEVYIELFNYIINSNKKNIQSIIQTNGSLLKSKKELMVQFLPYISELYISFDAGTEETYKLTRVGGDWNRLLENTKFIVDLIKENNFKTNVRADFVVQRYNYKELPQFANVCKELGIRPNRMQKMWNWGTWDQSTFDDLNVYNPSHELYNDVKKYFKLANLPMANN